jgi:hypothetical protein
MPYTPTWAFIWLHPGRQIPGQGALPETSAGNDRVVTKAPAGPQRPGKDQPGDR